MTNPKPSGNKRRGTTPGYATARSAGTRSDDGNAFIRDPGDGPAHTRDDLAEGLAEEFLEGATGSNEGYGDLADAPVPEEIGGPFVVTDAREEFASGTDEANPGDATREPLPRSSAGLVQQPATDLAEEEDDDEDSTDTKPVPVRHP